MYVSVKREEKLSLTHLATKRHNAVDAKHRRQDVDKKHAFSKTLKQREKLSDTRRTDRVSSIRDNAEKRIKPKAKKPDFNSEKTHLEQKQPLKKASKTEHQAKQVDEKDLNAKESAVKEEFKSKKAENKEELSSMKKTEKLVDSKAMKEEGVNELTGENYPVELHRLSEIMMMLSDLIANFQNNSPEEMTNLEKASALIEELSSSEEGLNLMLANSKIDLTNVLSLDDFAKIFNLSEKDLKQTEEMMNQMKEFSLDLYQTLSQEGELKEDSLQNLMAKLNVFSTEIIKQSESTTSQNDKIVLESQDPEEILVEEHKENASENTSSGGGNQAKMEKFIKSAETVVNKTTKVDGEGFALKSENLESKQDIQKINLDLQKNLKANMKTEIFEQIKNHIAKQSIKEDKSEMIIRLRPEELGKVELKIEVHKDQVIAKMNVASQMVKEAIEANLSDLKSSLKDKGFDVGSFDVNVNDDSDSQGGQSSNRGNRGRKVLHVEESAEGVSERYVRTLEGLEQGSTLEFLA